MKTVALLPLFLRFALIGIKNNIRNEDYDRNKGIKNVRHEDYDKRPTEHPSVDVGLVRQSDNRILAVTR